jgi:hypothetical protein
MKRGFSFVYVRSENGKAPNGITETWRILIQIKTVQSVKRYK